MGQSIKIFQEGNVKLLLIQKLIAKNKWSDKNIGIFRGKMADVLFYYKLFRFSSSSQHRDDYLELAKNNLDDIYTHLNVGTNVVDFSNGLAGIAFAINYLIKNEYEEGDVDDILSDLDDTIFRHIAHSSMMPIDIDFGILGFMVYLIPRVKTENIDSTKSRDYISKRLLISLINHLGEAMEKDDKWYKEPPLFKITWDLPLILKLLADARDLNIYDYKIDKLINYISENVLSMYPKNQSNRLSLLIGIKSIIGYNQKPEWQLHADVLRAGIDLDHILYYELKDKNIELIDGTSGIYWLVKEYNRLCNTKDAFNIKREKFIERLIYSSYWNEQEKDNEYLKYNFGLLQGISGIGFTLIDLLD